MFRRIAAGVRPIPGAAMGYFYWAAIERFVRSKQVELVPEVVAGFCTLDRETYDAEALEHVQRWAMAAGCEAAALALAERCNAVVWADDGLTPYSGPEEDQMMVESMYGDLDDRPKTRKKAPLNLLDCLEPSGMERRAVRHTRGFMGTDEPKAKVLLEAHTDLLHFARPRGLIEADVAAKSEANIVRLLTELGLPL